MRILISELKDSYKYKNDMKKVLYLAASVIRSLGKHLFLLSFVKVFKCSVIYEKINV